MNCLTSITESFGLLCEEHKIRLGHVFDSLNPTPDQLKVKEWISANWKMLHKCFKAMIPKDIDEVLTQQILNNLQSWINITASLQLSQARDSMLLTLCQGCLPTGISPFLNICSHQYFTLESNKEITTKNIQTSKILFNVAHCLGGLLDVNSWHIILTTLQKTDTYLKKVSAKNQNDKRRSQGPLDRLSTISTGEEDTHTMDLQILESALESLFEQSQYTPVKNMNLIMFKFFLKTE